MPASAPRSSTSVPAAGAERLRQFLGQHAAVRIREDGRVIARLRPEHCGFSLSTERGALVCHFWSPEANLVRRVHAVLPDDGTATLRLDCLRMGRARPTRMVLDARPEELSAVRLAREEFGQAVATAATRDWPEWRLDAGGSGATGPVRRYLFRRGTARMACAAVSARESAGAAESALAAGLIWAETLRERSPASPLEVRLVVPEAAWRVLQPRLPWLEGAERLTAYAFDAAAGTLTPWPADGAGNRASQLRRVPDAGAAFPAAAQALLAEVRQRCPEATLAFAPDGSSTITLLGLEFVRADGAGFSFGCGSERTPLSPATRPLFESLLDDLRQRSPAGNRHHIFYAAQPERWMECLVRRALERIAPHADPRFVYAQVPVCRPGHRDIVDLVATDREGRLLVLELKASPDAGFPLQALDYWLAVRHHQQLGDFGRLGYFPGVPLSPLPPRLLLVAPALQWHPSTPAVLRWISPRVPIERLGLCETWRESLRVVARW